MSATICGFLSDLEKIGWRIDYSCFSGETIVKLLQHADVRGLVAFNSETDHVCVSFRVETACVKNVHTESFTTLLRGRLKNEAEVQFSYTSPGDFEVSWSVHKPTLFESENEAECAEEFWKQFERCRVFVLSYTHVLEVLGSRPTIRRVPAPVKNPVNLADLVTFCLLEQPESGRLH